MGILKNRPERCNFSLSMKCYSMNINMQQSSPNILRLYPLSVVNNLSTTLHHILSIVLFNALEKARMSIEDGKSQVTESPVHAENGSESTSNHDKVHQLEKALEALHFTSLSILVVFLIEVDYSYSSAPLYPKRRGELFRQSARLQYYV